MASSSTNEQANASIFQNTSQSTATQQKFTAGPKLSIKLDDKNFLLWNQQVEGVVKMHMLHRFLVNPTIPQKFATDADRVADVISPEFENWLIQDQTLFTWLLSTLSESVLPRVLTCHHSWEIWERIQQHYFSHLKAKVRQLRNELKKTKKGANTISEFITKIHSLADSLISIGEDIPDSYLTDVLLDGLPEEYNSFVMMIFSKSDTPPLSEIESLLLVQEMQLDKFRQELVVANASANVANVASNSTQNNGAHALKVLVEISHPTFVVEGARIGEEDVDALLLLLVHDLPVSCVVAVATLCLIAVTGLTSPLSLLQM